MPSSGAWLRQANSDMFTVNRLLACNSEDLFCQISAKCQQIVEKSVKSIAAELTDRGIVTLTIGFIHSTDGLIAPILRTPHHKSLRNSAPEYITSTLRNNLSSIKELMSLAPHEPSSSERLPRNTEYPFHNEQGVIIAPSDKGVFNKIEIEKHVKVAGAVLKQAMKLIIVSERAPN